MKNIYLLADENAWWQDIEHYLKSVNARVIRSSPEVVAEGFVNTPPSIIIISDDYHSEARSFRFRHYAMIIVGKLGKPGAVRTSPDNPKWVTVNWPLAAGDFLKLTADLTEMSERKMFRTIVRFFPEGSEFTYMGESIDFSRSGMAFKAPCHVEAGTRGAISFVLPGMEKSVQFSIEIMRSSFEKGETVFGGTFVEPEQRTLQALEDFIART